MSDLTGYNSMSQKQKIQQEKNKQNVFYSRRYLGSHFQSRRQNQVRVNLTNIVQDVDKQEFLMFLNIQIYPMVYLMQRVIPKYHIVYYL